MKWVSRRQESVGRNGRKVGRNGRNENIDVRQTKALGEI